MKPPNTDPIMAENAADIAPSAPAVIAAAPLVNHAEHALWGDEEYQARRAKIIADGQRANFWGSLGFYGQWSGLGLLMAAPTAMFTSGSMLAAAGAKVGAWLAIGAIGGPAIAAGALVAGLAVIGFSIYASQLSNELRTVSNFQKFEMDQARLQDATAQKIGKEVVSQFVGAGVMPAIANAPPAADISDTFQRPLNAQDIGAMPAFMADAREVETPKWAPKFASKTLGDGAGFAAQIDAERAAAEKSTGRNA